MYGAIIGDLAGSIYEYSQIKKVTNINVLNIIEDNAFYSDDTILTMAIMDAILNDKDYNKYLKKYISKFNSYKPLFSPYFKTTFSPSLIKWANSNVVGTSKGNGAMMRISPVGYLFDTEKEVKDNAYLATIPSHYDKEVVNLSTLVALIIFYFRNGWSKEKVFNYLKIKPQYEPFKKFNVTCNETIGNCLYALYYSSSFEDAIRKVVSFGGDTDTNASITGSMAEALYGIDKKLIDRTNEIIPSEFVKKIELCSQYKNYKF